MDNIVGLGFQFIWFSHHTTCVFNPAMAAICMMLLIQDLLTTRGLFTLRAHSITVRLNTFVTIQWWQLSLQRAQFGPVAEKL